MGRGGLDKERATEVLAAHADRLIGQAIQPVSLTDEEREELAPLFCLAEQLYRNMRPVQASPAFVRSLGKELAHSARQQVALNRRGRKGLLIGAATVGSLVSIVSVVGAIIFVVARWRAHSHTRTAHA